MCIFVKVLAGAVVIPTEMAQIHLCRRLVTTHHMANVLKIEFQPSAPHLLLFVQYSSIYPVASSPLGPHWAWALGQVNSKINPRSSQLMIPLPLLRNIHSSISVRIAGSDEPLAAFSQYAVERTTSHFPAADLTTWAPPLVSPAGKANVIKATSPSKETHTHTKCSPVSTSTSRK